MSCQGTAGHPFNIDNKDDRSIQDTGNVGGAG